MKSVMEHTFSEVPAVDIPRSSFNRSHGHKTAFDADYLVPILVDEMLPGDTFNVGVNFMARLATPLHPIMDNMFLDTLAFFTPNRLLWDNWERFQGAQDNPSSSIEFTIPKYDPTTTADMTGSSAQRALADYFGLPHLSSVDLSEFSALPFRAYNLIWNEWFRAQDLQDSVTVDTDNGPDTITQYGLLKRGKRHDYFTSALPWPQKGDAVDLPLGTSAPVYNSGGTTLLLVGNTAQTGVENIHSQGVGNDSTFAAGTGSYPGAVTLKADLTNATAATINDIRLAFQTQRLLERDARSGTRYVESIKAHFGVTVPDFRLQRPEYLGGGSTRINVTPVANTSEDATSKQGDLTGFGTASGRHSFTFSAVEHGILIVLANLRGDITYSQGAERYWFKDTRYDFYLPVLSQIGEQSILNKEIYYQNTAADDNVWGYTERYNEYRYKPSRLSSVFRPDNAASLEAWHLSEEFLTLPTLGDTFIQSNTGVPLDRAIAVNTEPHLIADFYFDMKCARPMPVYGVPGNLDHF